MSEELMVKNCAPTLAGIKTGNMFLAPYADKAEMISDIRSWNRRFADKGLRVLPMRYIENKALIYVYRPKCLACDFRNESVCRLLNRCGYLSESPDRCVVRLLKRMKECGEFPHEVGLFLGYPPEDVCGFIENKAKKCKCVGYWKVYGDEEKAKKTFAKYKKCTDVYSRLYACGQSVERLAVAG